MLHWSDAEGATEQLPSVSYPIRFSTDLDDPSPPERLGESTERYLRSLGYSDVEIETLREAGVV